jgi:hypothetical protein
MPDRTQIRAELATLTAYQTPPMDPGLLEALPQLPARFADLLVSTRHKLYQAFAIEILFNHGIHQITCRTTITTSTPDTVAAIINDTQPPTPTSSDFPCTPTGGNGRSEQAQRPAMDGELVIERTADLAQPTPSPSPQHRPPGTSSPNSMVTRPPAHPLRRSQSPP